MRTVHPFSLAAMQDFIAVDAGNTRDVLSYVTGHVVLAGRFNAMVASSAGRYLATVGELPAQVEFVGSPSHVFIFECIDGVVSSFRSGVEVAS